MRMNRPSNRQGAIKNSHAANAALCSQQRGQSVQNIDVLCVHGSGSVSAGSIKAVLRNSSNSSGSFSTSISSSHQINSQSSASFPALFAPLVVAVDMKINHQPASSCLGQISKKTKKEPPALEIQYRRGM